MTDLLPLPRFALPRAGRHALRRLEAWRHEIGAEAGDPAAAARLEMTDRALAEFAAGGEPPAPELAALLAEFPQPRQAAALARALLRDARRAANPEPFPDYAALAQHLRDAANPHGRLWLLAGGVRDPRAQALADGLCTALALVAILAEAPAAARPGRLRLPLDELARHRVQPDALAGGTPGPGWGPLMMMQIERARRMLQAAAPLASRLRGRQRLAVRIAVIRAEALLRKLHRTRGGTPVAIGPADWPYLALRVAFGR